MNRRTVLMLVGAALLSVGLYLLPVGQDFVWYWLYEAAGRNVALAWTYLYVISLGLIGIGVLIVYGVYNRKIGLTRIGGRRR